MEDLWGIYSKHNSSLTAYISYLAVNWILFCIADLLEQCCFTSIRPPNNEDVEVGVLGSEFRSFFWIGRYRWYSGC